MYAQMPPLNAHADLSRELELYFMVWALKNKSGRLVQFIQMLLPMRHSYYKLK